VRGWKLKRRLGIGIFLPWRIVSSTEDPVADSSETIAPFPASHGKGLYRVSVEAAASETMVVPGGVYQYTSPSRNVFDADILVEIQEG